MGGTRCFLGMPKKIDSFLPFLGQGELNIFLEAEMGRGLAWEKQSLIQSLAKRKGGMRLIAGAPVGLSEKTRKCSSKIQHLSFFSLPKHFSQQIKIDTSLPLFPPPLTLNKKCEKKCIVVMLHLKKKKRRRENSFSFGIQFSPFLHRLFAGGELFKTR